MSDDTFRVLYRGTLSSCNYACTYCPFAKTKDSRANLSRDAMEVERFVAWAGDQSDRRLGVLFTPWGEALIRPHYQRALTALSWMPHVAKVAAQTNLSGELSWLKHARAERVGLWCTYHPSQVSRDRFLAACQTLDELGVGYSVGMVGVRGDLPEIEAMRTALRPEVYLWVNANRRQSPYSDGEVKRILAIDPEFRENLTDHVSQGRACRAGHSVISVVGDGSARRCHFIDAPIGNIYEPGFMAGLRQSPCSNATCHCHIGYIHMPHLGLYERYGEGLLERIPSRDRRQLPLLPTRD